MAGYKPLPSEFTWRDDGERMVLSLRDIPLAHIERTGSGWVVRTLIHLFDHQAEPPSRIAVPSLQHGKAWITRWAQCRRAAFERAVELKLSDSHPSGLRRAS